MVCESDDVEAELGLSEVLDALRDPIRREVVRRLSHGEAMCSAFADLGSPSGMSYHFTRLRTSGLTDMRKSGTCRLISLRMEAIEAAFPGLLSSILLVMERDEKNETSTNS